MFTAALLSVACAVGLTAPGAAAASTSAASALSPAAGLDEQLDTVRTETSERPAPQPARWRRRLPKAAVEPITRIARLVRRRARLVPHSAAWRGPPVLLI